MTSSWDEFEEMVKSVNTDDEFERLSVSSDFSAKLIKARLKMNLTQAQLAERSGLKQSAIARIENSGSLPRIDTVYKLAKVFGYEFDFYPVDYEGDKNVTINKRISDLESVITDLSKEVRRLSQSTKKQEKTIILISQTQSSSTLIPPDYKPLAAASRLSPNPGRDFLKEPFPFEYSGKAFDRKEIRRWKSKN